jgi:protein-tyrosine phosphatase
MGVGLVFLPLGMLFVAFAAALGWWAMPIGWLGVSLTLVGVAFATQRPALLGKRADGSMHAAALVVYAPFLGLTWLVLALRRWRSEPAWNEVTPGLFLGRRATIDELPPATSLVVDLTCELPEARGVRRLPYRCLPSLDGCAPPRDEFVALVAAVASHDAPVFVHCAVGHGRSATLVAGVLLARGVARDVADAVALVERARPRVALTAPQLRLLRSLPFGGVSRARSS